MSRQVSEQDHVCLPSVTRLAEGNFRGKDTPEGLRKVLQLSPAPSGKGLGLTDVEDRVPRRSSDDDRLLRVHSVHSSGVEIEIWVRSWV